MNDCDKEALKEQIKAIRSCEFFCLAPFSFPLKNDGIAL